MSNKLKKRKSAPHVLTTCSRKEYLGGISYCTDHSGKMQGIHSVSTSCLVNKLCQARRANPCNVCHHCFAAAMMEGIYRHSMPDVLRDNTRILTSCILDDSVIPLFPTRNGRIESFGDLNNWIQAANYIKIIRRNPSTHFGWWTKNPQFIAEAIEHGYRLPKNVQIVYSSIELNRIASFDEQAYPFISKVFTVFSRDYLADHPEVDINCGARSCLACERCYHRNPSGVRVQFINERLK